MSRHARWLRVQGWGLGALVPHPARGQMLVIVLWVMGLLSVAIGALAVRSTHEMRLGRFPLERVQRKAIAQAAVQQAMALLSTDEPSIDHLEEPWATGEDSEEQQRLETMSVAQGTFSVGVWNEEEFAPGLIDEERKLNLNAAEPLQIQRLIELLQLPEVEPAAIAAAVVDWRDEGTISGSPCEGQTPECHNGLFGSMDELRLVPGMTPELFETLQPHVTVYGSGMVNINTAQVLVLDALGCPGAQLIEQRQSSQEGPFSTPPPTCLNTAVSSTVFTVPVEVSLATSSTLLVLHAIIDRTGTILAWHPQ